MSMIPISSAMTVGRAVRLHRPVLRLRGLGRRATAPGDLAVPRRRDDRREVGHLPRGHGGVRAREPPARARAPSTRAASTREIVPLGDVDRRRGPAPRARRSRRWPALKPLAEGGRLTAAVASARSPTAPPRCSSRRERAVKRPRAHAAGPHPPPVSVRGDDPVCMLTAPIPATALRAREGRHDARRHRPGRDQRGVRLGRARLAEGDRRRPRARSTSTAARSRSATRSAPPARA